MYSEKYIRNLSITPACHASFTEWQEQEQSYIFYIAS